MSRRKDRERFLAMQASNPTYRGFRGYDQAPSGPEGPALEAITCSVCGRRRNVPVEVAREQGDSYVCLSCREEGEQEEQGEGAKPQEASAQEAN